MDKKYVLMIIVIILTTLFIAYYLIKYNTIMKENPNKK